MSQTWPSFAEAHGDHPLPAVSFVPEPHLPGERRLVIDSSGITMETAFGFLTALPWDRCSAVLRWGDRVEVALEGGAGLIIRADDWHHGELAVAAVVARAPRALVVTMADEPESVDLTPYVLRGLAKTSAVVLWTLAGAAAIMAVTGLTIGGQNDNPVAVGLGVAFLVLTMWTLDALRRRLAVPRHWRVRAAQRGRVTVQIDSRIARATDQHLKVAEVGLYLAAGAVGLGLFQAGLVTPWPSFALLFIAFAVGRERRRRDDR